VEDLGQNKLEEDLAVEFEIALLQVKKFVLVGA